MSDEMLLITDYRKLMEKADTLVDLSMRTRTIASQKLTAAMELINSVPVGTELVHEKGNRAVVSGRSALGLGADGKIQIAYYITRYNVNGQPFAGKVSRAGRGWKIRSTGNPL